MKSDALVVFATFPEVEVARRIVSALVEEKLAACGNLIPNVESIYRWEGAVQTSGEVFAVLKTETGRYAELEARLLALHPYKTPECIALNVAAGAPAYLRWITDSLRPN